METDFPLGPVLLRELTMYSLGAGNVWGVLVWSSEQPCDVGREDRA